MVVEKLELDFNAEKGREEFDKVCSKVIRMFEEDMERVSQTSTFENLPNGMMGVREITLDESKEVLNELSVWTGYMESYLENPDLCDSAAKMNEQLQKLIVKAEKNVQTKEHQAEIRQQREEAHTEAYEGAKARYNERSTFKKFLDKITGRAPDWNKVMELSNDEMNKLYQRKGDRSERNSGDDRSL